MTMGRILARMNDFTRNFDDEFKTNTALYKKIKEHTKQKSIEDKSGIWHAYDISAGLKKTDDILNISGASGKDGSINRGIVDDLSLVPTKKISHSEKYQDVMKYLGSWLTPAYRDMSC